MKQCCVVRLHLWCGSGDLCFALISPSWLTAVKKQESLPLCLSLSLHPLLMLTRGSLGLYPRSTQQRKWEKKKSGGRGRSRRNVIISAIRKYQTDYRIQHGRCSFWIEDQEMHRHIIQDSQSWFRHKHKHPARATENTPTRNLFVENREGKVVGVVFCSNNSFVRSAEVDACDQISSIFFFFNKQCNFFTKDRKSKISLERCGCEWFGG